MVSCKNCGFWFADDLPACPSCRTPSNEFPEWLFVGQKPDPTPHSVFSSSSPPGVPDPHPNPWVQAFPRGDTSLHDLPSNPWIGMDEDFPESPPLSSPLPEEHRPDTKPAIPLAPVNAPESGNALATEAAQTWIVSAETSLVDNVGTDLVPKEQGTESDCATASDVNGIAGGGAEESWEGPPTQWMSSADLPKELISESVPTAREEPVEPPSVMMPTPTDPVLSAAPVLPTVPTGALPVSTLPAVQTERITEDDSVRWKSLPSASIPEHLFVPSPPTEFREETLMRPDSGDALMDAPRRATAPRATGLDYIAQRRHVTSLKLVIIIGAAMLIISTLAVAQIFFG